MAVIDQKDRIAAPAERAVSIGGSLLPQLRANHTVTLRLGHTTDDWRLRFVPPLSDEDAEQVKRWKWCIIAALVKLDELVRRIEAGRELLVRYEANGGGGQYPERRNVQIDREVVRDILMPRVLAELGASA